MHHCHPVGDADDFLHVRGDHHDRDALIGELAHQRVDLAFGTDIDAAGGLVEEHHARLHGKPLAQHYFLLVAAGERHGLHIDARSLDGQAPCLFFRDLVLGRAVDQPHPRIIQQARERHVLPDRQFQHQPGFLAVLRHQIDALPDRIPRRRDTDRRVVDPDLAAQQRVNAEGRAGEGGAARAHEPCQAEDLAMLHGKINLPVGKG